MLLLLCISVQQLVVLQVTLAFIFSTSSRWRSSPSVNFVCVEKRLCQKIEGISSKGWILERGCIRLRGSGLRSQNFLWKKIATNRLSSLHGICEFKRETSSLLQPEEFTEEKFGNYKKTCRSLLYTILKVRSQETDKLR